MTFSLCLLLPLWHNSQRIEKCILSLLLAFQGYYCSLEFDMAIIYILTEAVCLYSIIPSMLTNMSLDRIRGKHIFKQICTFLHHTDFWKHNISNFLLAYWWSLPCQSLEAAWHSSSKALVINFLKYWSTEEKPISSVKDFNKLYCNLSNCTSYW